MSLRRYIGTITRHQTDHKGLFHFELVGGDLGGMSHANACWAVSRALGRVMPRDYGKRAYLVDGVCQVENDEQRAERLRS